MCGKRSNCNCGPQLGIAWKWCSWYAMISIFSFDHNVKCVRCTCVPTIIYRVCVCVVRRLVCIVSCSDSNRIVASQQSLFQIIYACSLLIYDSSNRSAFLFACFQLHLRYVRGVLLHQFAAAWSDFSARVFHVVWVWFPCYFCTKPIETKHIASAAFYSNEYILARIRVNTCAIVWLCSVYCTVYTVYMLRHILLEYMVQPNKLEYYKSGELNCLPT